MKQVDVPHFIEWLKLIASTATPLVLFFFGILAKKYADRSAAQQSRSAVAAAWRLEVFRSLLPKLNEMYCYFTYQGDWRRLSPDEARVSKRECDRIFHSNEFLWADDTKKNYRKFADTAFVEGRGPGKDFAFRANAERHRENPNWRDEWVENFVEPNERVRRDEFVASYNALMRSITKDLGVF